MVSASSLCCASFFFISVVIVVFQIKPGTSEFANILSPADLNLKQKLTHLHFYFHDIVEGPNATVINVAGKGPGNFGMVWVMDDPLTEGPDVTSKLVGKAQGIYSFASKEEIGLLMVMNFAFMEGKYNGSVLSVLGKNSVFNTVREMPIVGGSGLFRFARGYVLAKTYSFDIPNAVVEYNVYVLHY